MVAVAYSGGRDSTALLHATANAAAALGVSVIALHVHHGLSAEADAWLAHCIASCHRLARRGLSVDVAFRSLDGKPAAGESVEAWARRERYRALAEMAVEHGSDLVLLAHHRRDQAETFLLQAMRGGGVGALAAMPRLARRDGVTWARPWLAQPREVVEAYARRHRLRWIDDDSNDDDRFARNRLRLRVWPPLLAAFPEAEAALAAAAERVGHAAEAIDELVTIDLAAIADERGLDLERWRRLSIARQRHALLGWLRHQLAGRASATLVERLMREASADRDRRWPTDAGELRSYRGILQRVAITPTVVGAEPRAIDLSRPGVHAAPPWQGAFRVAAVERGGIAAAAAAKLVVRARAPGDRFQAGVRRPSRSLKLQYQARGIAPALRGGPVVCRADDVPVFVPGLGIDARALAAEGEPQVSIEWLPQSPGVVDGRRGRAR